MDDNNIYLHNEDAEQQLISCAMLGASREVYHSNKITHKSFYNSTNASIFEAIERLRDKKIPIEVLTIDAELQKMGCAVDKEYLRDTLSTSLTITSVVTYASIVRDCERLRGVIKICEQIKREALNTQNANESLNIMRGKLFNYLNEEERGDEDSIETVVDNVISELATGEVKPICSTGYYYLDKLVKGYGEGQLWTIAGATGQGKTTISLNLFIKIFMQHVKSAFFTIEMTKEEIVRKILSNILDIDYSLLCGNIDKDVYNLVATDGKDNIMRYEEEINIIDSCSKYSDVVNKIYELADKGVKVFFIDYIQLIQGNKSLSRQLEIGEMTSGFKRLANELKVCIVILSQISRASGKDRADGKPTLQDLSRSSSIEHDSTVVIMLFSELLRMGAELCEGLDKKTLEMLVRKNRFGALGDAPVFFDRDKSKVYDIPEDQRKEVLENIGISNG